MDKKLKKALDQAKHQGIVDVSKISEYREMEDYNAEMQDAAGKCQEITEIGKAMFIANPTLTAVECIAKAEEFFDAASNRVNELITEVGEPPVTSQNSKLITQ